MSEVALKCSCGTVKGTANHIKLGTGTRLICCCDDCQAFARYLAQEDVVLDEYGGTDILQIPVAHIQITAGMDKIRCMSLSPKGMFRWYANCCKTPIGNTMAAGMPFIGLIHTFMDDVGRRDANLGPALGYSQTRFAKKAVPSKKSSSGLPARILIRSLSRVLIWKLKGLNKPSPFFDASGKPVSKPHISASNSKS